MSRTLPFLMLAAVLMCPPPSHAQAKDAFVAGLVELAGAVDGTFGDEGPRVTKAIDAMAAGLAQWDAAIARAETGLSSDIGKVSPQIAARMRTALGTIYLERGRLDAALAQFTAAIELDPGFPDVHVLRGMTLGASGRRDEAAASYRAARDRDRDSPTTAYLALRSMRDTESVDALAARRTLASAVEQRVASEGAGAPTRFLTVSLLDDASVSEPAFAPAAYAEAFALLGRGRYEDAILRLRQAASRDALVTDAALRSPAVSQAIDAVRREQPAAAIPGLLAAVERSAESSEMHRALGVAYWSAQKYDSSLEQFRLAVRLNPADERARIAIADVLVASGDLAQAREALAATLQAIPGSARASWKLGRLHQVLGDGENAIRSLTAAAERQPYVGAGQLFAAIGAIEHGRLELAAAASAYERRIDVNPNAAAAHVGLGDIYLAQERNLDAMREYLAAALLDPGNARAFAAIGQVQAGDGHDDDAVRTLRRAVTLDPAHLEARYALSRALLRLGRADEARVELGVFQQLQAKSLEEERRRFQENQVTIEEALKSSPAPATGR